MDICSGQPLELCVDLPGITFPTKLKLSTLREAFIGNAVSASSKVLDRLLQERDIESYFVSALRSQISEGSMECIIRTLSVHYFISVPSDGDDWLL